MNLLHTIALTALLVSNVYAVTATKELDPQLLSIFEQMQVKTEQPKLEGKEFKADLTVKIATAKFLVFSDAYLKVDEETKYQIGKWIFTPDQIVTQGANRGEVWTVGFKVEEILTEQPYEEMPHFTAQILSMVPARKKVDPVGGDQ